MPIRSESKSGNLDPTCSQQMEGRWGRQQGNSRDGTSLSQRQPQPQTIPFHEAPHRGTGGGPGGRRFAGISHHGEGAMFEWQRQRSHKSHAASYLQPTHREERNSPQHTVNDCRANGQRGEAISSRETDVRVLSSSQDRDPVSRACGNACKVGGQLRKASSRGEGQDYLSNQVFQSQVHNSKVSCWNIPCKVQHNCKG